MNLKNLIPADKPICFVMVGIPGSGKSTAISKITKAFPNTTVVCPDEYRKQLGGSYSNFDNDSKIWSDICPTNINKALSSNNNVVFDATNVAVKRRKSILNWIKHDCFKVAVVLPLNVDVALKQNKQRDPDKVVPDSVIHRMASQFVAPSKSEGFDEILKIKN
jgi:predicted kinase